MSPWGSRLHRRQILAALGVGGLTAALPAWARAKSEPTVLSGEHIHLTIGHAMHNVDGKALHAITINGTVPGPLIRLREGQIARISVTNTLSEDTSIHWHGLLVPFQMDGVPGVSGPGIRPGETFTYEFPVRQSGTYWYHSHSGLQEPMGHYGSIVVEPSEPDPVAFEREHVVVLSDISAIHPHTIFRRLKAGGGAFNFRKQTLAGLLAGEDQRLAERRMWARMRMDPTDIADVTGATFSFLVNGHGPKDNWTGLYTPGERVRLRIINAAAQSVFNVRIPGLKLTIVAADGQNVRPVEVDEFQIGNAETYDVIVRPADDRAYTLVAEASDRSGMGRATLAPRAGMTAEVPPLRERPLLTMRDMGMDHAMGGPATVAALPGFAPPRDRDAPLMDHAMAMRDGKLAPKVKMGPGVEMIAPMPMDRTGEPGQGLASVGHRVLVYRDLEALTPNPDSRPPSRNLEIHLTGNMERFIWGFDGRKFSDRPEPYTLRSGERVRVTLVNDTMMTHPVHMHGHFFELAHGPVGRRVRKHTVNVLPGGKVAFDVTGETGDWAFHCHMMYHMHAGMFQVFAVRPEAAGRA